MAKVDEKTEPETPKRAPRKGPDFGLKLLDGVSTLPEEKARSRKTSVPEVHANLLALQEHPNVWAEVALYAAKAGSDQNPTGAKKTALKYTSGELKPPKAVEGAGSYDIEWRSADWDGSDREGTVLLAMYIPND